MEELSGIDYEVRKQIGLGVDLDEVEQLVDVEALDEEETQFMKGKAKNKQ